MVPVAPSDNVKSIVDVVPSLQRGCGDNLLAVVLFGSRARGDATEWSDWDLLVLTRNLPQRPLQRLMELKMMLPAEWRARVSLLAKTPEEFEAHISTLMLEIALDGIIFYDPTGYGADRITALRAVISQRGLYRERQGKNLIWRWKVFPGFDWELQWESALDRK